MVHVCIYLLSEVTRLDLIYTNSLPMCMKFFKGVNVKENDQEIDNKPGLCALVISTSTSISVPSSQVTVTRGLVDNIFSQLSYC